MTKTTEWATRITYHDDTTMHEQQSGREYAEALADSVAAYIVGVDAPTRTPGDIKTVDVVSREVSVAADGTQTIGPWRVVRPGRVRA